MLCMVFPYVLIDFQLPKPIQAHPGLQREKPVRNDGAVQGTKVMAAQVAVLLSHVRSYPERVTSFSKMP